MKKLALDFDGVLCMSYPWLAKHMLDRFDIDVGNVETKTSFGYENGDQLKEACDVGTETARAILNYQQYMLPVRDAITFAHNYASLFDNPVPITIISARHQSTINVTEKWWEKWFRGLPFSLYLVENHLEKRRVCEDLGVTHFIDDRYKTVCDLAKTLDTVFCLDWPYNRRPLPQNAIRVNKLNDMIPYLTA